MFKFLQNITNMYINVKIERAEISKNIGIYFDSFGTNIFQLESFMYVYASDNFCIVISLVRIREKLI